MNLLPYGDARSLIQEGDVLLFRGSGIISWLIQRYGSGMHSHVGMAHWDGQSLHCVEFREFKGGRSVALRTQVSQHSERIDVFRPAKQLVYETNEFNLTDEIRSKITNIMLEMTGLPYGWKNIWKLAKHYLPFFRLAPQNVKDDDVTNIFVCSTAVAYAYRSAYVDPVPYLADAAVAPPDLARSALFEYQFTLKKDW